MASRSSKSKETKTPSYLDRVEQEVSSNQSKLSLVLGILIVLVIGVLLFNYFNRNKDQQLTPPQPSKQDQQGDVSPESLPGKYTIKEGDTLFVVAEKYYQDGYKYTEIAKANNLVSADSIEVGQTLEIPKLEGQTVESSPTPQPTSETKTDDKGGQVSSTSTTEWGAPITGNSYTVQAGDWLSKIAARSYGDVYAFDKIAKANNIQNPDVIEVGMVLKIPR